VANYRDFANAMGDAGQNAGSLTGDLQGTTEAIARQKEELGQVVSRFAQFGTMAGILRTFGRVVRSAFASVKELDEAMNNIAVVTDYTTKDLWN
jgi:ABC-type transporter Mla subunit MlaD